MEKREGNVQVVSLRRGEEWRKKEKRKKKKRKKGKTGRVKKTRESRSGSQMEDPAIRT